MPNQTITIDNTEYDLSGAVEYHYGGFPPPPADLAALLFPLTEALQQVTRYDERLKTLHNSELLLAPLRGRDAVVSSRMEGTVSTLEEVLSAEANERANRVDTMARNEATEVRLYARALRQAQSQMAEGYPLSETVLRQAHRTLLSFGRGARKNPGEYKTRQNYIGDERQRKIYFVPIAPERLGSAMKALFDYIREPGQQALLRASMAHVEFEALHPFDDGNGRVGRMLIPLMLWQDRILSAPHFFVSDYFERHKDDYLARMRAVSATGDWTGWCAFFLTALASQAVANLDVVDRISTLYEDTRAQVRDVLRSQYSDVAVDFMFTNPIFWNNHFVDTAQAPRTTVQGFTRKLVEADILRTRIPPAGRAPGRYAFQALLDILDPGD